MKILWNKDFNGGRKCTRNNLGNGHSTDQGIRARVDKLSRTANGTKSMIRDISQLVELDSQIQIRYFFYALLTIYSTQWRMMLKSTWDREKHITIKAWKMQDR